MIDKLKTKIYNLLRWSEKYFKTDMIYLARGGFWLTLGQVISSASSFLLAIAFANLLPKETYGTYKYVLSIAGILAIPTLSGMGIAVTQAVARGYEGSLIPALKTKIRWGLFGGLASLILSGYYFYQGNTTLTISFLISAAFLPLMDSFGIYDAFLQGRKLFDISAKYGIISQIIAVIILITTLFFTKNLFFILFVYFFSWTSLRFFFFKLTLKKFLPNQKQDSGTISYGKHLSLIRIIGTIDYQIDRVLIFHYLGAQEVAIYSIAIAPPEQIKSLLKNIGALVFPKLAQKSKEEIRKTIFKKFFTFFIFLIPLTIIYVLFTPFLYKIFFPHYLTSSYYSQIFVLTILFLPFYFLGTIVLQSQKKQAELYQLKISISLIEIILLFIFIHFYGLMGAILVKIISRFIESVFSLWLIKKI
jgi:O-antigen/teichoic acid export membrane protein